MSSLSRVVLKNTGSVAATAINYTDYLSGFSVLWVKALSLRVILWSGRALWRLAIQLKFLYGTRDSWQFCLFLCKCEVFDGRSAKDQAVAGSL